MSGPLVNGFQGSVKNQPAPAVAGDFYGANPRATVLGGPGQFNAPADGAIVGQFIWVNSDTSEVSTTYQAGWQLGFLHRENNAIIVDFLEPATMLVLQGLPLSLFSQGDFWAKFAGGATPGQAVYADPSTGAALAGPAGGLTSAVVTASAGFAGTAAMGASFTGVIATNVLTTSAQTGFITEGDILAGAGITPGTLIGAQLTGPAGGEGTYTVVHANVSSVAMTTTSKVLVVSAVTRGALQVGSTVTGGGIAASTVVESFIAGTGGVGRYLMSGAAQSSASGAKLASTDVLDVTAVTSGILGVGSVLSGSGVTGGTVIVEQLTGAAGGIGTYRISPVQNFASTTVSEGAVATPWKVNSVAAAGELAKISSWG